MGVNDLIDEWRKVQLEWMDATDAADDLADLARTAWRPVSEPPEYELIRGIFHPSVLWLEDEEEKCPERVGAQDIGTRAAPCGWWAWPRDVVLMPPEDK